MSLLLQVGNRWKTTTTVIVEMKREIVCRSRVDCGFNDDDICFRFCCRFKKPSAGDDDGFTESIIVNFLPAR